MKYDYLVVGAGLFGSIFAYEANKLNKKVLVIDRRDHLGGNCYTEAYEDYHIHKYGPHVFHTSQKYIWDYINQFTKINNFSARVKSFVNDKIYRMPINLQTMSQVWPDIITPKQARLRLEQEIIPNDNPKNLEEHCLSMIGPTLYNLFIKEYTTKQWGKDPKELPASIIKRLPVRFDMNDRYYHDSHVYEGIPKDGYTKIFERMLEGIDIELSTDYFNDREYFDKLASKVIYSGPIDKFFDYIYGDLEYRSLLFTRTFYSNYDYQGTAVVNYPELKYNFTRVIQHRHFNFGKSKRDIVTHEYPQTYSKDKEPYYPINNEINNEIYTKYKNESDKLNNVIIGGRLGNYKYYDMDMSIGNALSTVKKEFAGK